jgi:hypothetical protein
VGAATTPVGTVTSTAEQHGDGSALRQTPHRDSP